MSWYLVTVELPGGGRQTDGVYVPDSTPAPQQLGAAIESMFIHFPDCTPIGAAIMPKGAKLSEILDRSTGAEVLLRDVA